MTEAAADLPGQPLPGPAVDRDLPLDAHLHTQRSPDSAVPLDAYCAAAVERGIAEIIITDHVDFEPGAAAYGYATFADRERDVREAAERWAPRGLAVRFGIEATYQASREAEIRDYLAKHPYDFAIGSCHAGRGGPYTPGHVRSWCAGRSLTEAVEPYFTEVLAAARSGLFDTLGHLDVVKKYVAADFPAVLFAAAPELYEPVLRALVESGTALEVNASGLRHAPGEPYPAPWAVTRYRELGGRLVTAGSDAHQGDQFAFGLARVYADAARAGFAELAFRRAAADGRASALATIPERLLPHHHVEAAPR